MVAVPVGPLGLLCVNRALSRGPLYGLFSGMGVATADALAAGITALGMTLISDFLIDHQTFLRTVGGLFLCYLGIKIYRTKPATQIPVGEGGGLARAYATTFLLTVSNPVTILSFVAIYAGWGIRSLSGRYLAAALLAGGVFPVQFYGGWPLRLDSFSFVIASAIAHWLGSTGSQEPSLPLSASSYF